VGSPYKDLYIYEVRGILDRVPESWRERGYLGCWYEGGYSFLFFSCPSKEFVLRELPSLGDFSLRTETSIPYEQWEAGVPLGAFRVGSFWIAPPWEMEPSPEVLVIDPGVSFGSGFHDSTRGCLHLLLELFGEKRPEKVLDLGTGSGILALFALKLGAKKAICVDCQPIAVEAALANGRRNFMEERMEVVLGDAIEWASIEADLLLANLHLELIVRLLEKPGFPLARWCILSGFVGGQWELILEKAKGRSLELVSKRWEGDFCSLLLERTNCSVEGKDTGKGGPSRASLAWPGRTPEIAMGGKIARGPVRFMWKFWGPTKAFHSGRAEPAPPRGGLSKLERPCGESPR
jgi:ribosomal protein L11 methyltransferase